jgi:hypothetical protein
LSSSSLPEGLDERFSCADRRFFPFGLAIGLPALDVIAGIKNGFGGTLAT